jgi:hypothetical protein
MTAAVGGIRVAPRVVGAALGAGISLSVAVVLAGAAGADLVDQGLEGLLALCSLGAAIGVPVGGLLGWIHAPAAASTGGSGRLLLVARLASLAVLLGAAVLSFGMAFGGLLFAGADVVSLSGAAATAAMLFFFGLLIFGVPAWGLAAAVCALWVMAVNELLSYDEGATQGGAK